MKNKIKSFIQIAADCFLRTDVWSYSVVISYYILLSLPPLLIILGNLLTLADLSFLLNSNYLSLLIPKEVLHELTPVAEAVWSRRNGGLLSIGIIAVLWSSGKGVDKIKSGINRAYGLSCGKSFVLSRFFSVLSLISVLLIFLVLLLFFSFGTSLISGLFSQKNIVDFFDLLKWPAALCILLTISVLIYKLSPDADLKLQDTLPGAIFAAMGMLLLVQIFSLILKFFFKSLTAYGTLSSFFLLMYWLSLMALILLLGAVINAAVYEYKYGRKAECKDRKHVKLLRSLAEKYKARKQSK